ASASKPPPTLRQGRMPSGFRFQGLAGWAWLRRSPSGEGARPDLGCRVRRCRAVHRPEGRATSARERTGRGGRDTAKSRSRVVTCGVVIGDDVPGVSAGGGRDPGGTMEVLTLTVACLEGLPPAHDIFPYRRCCPQPVPA